MTDQKFATNLRCGACVQKIRPILDSDPRIDSWSVDLDRPEKVLEIKGQGVALNEINSLLGPAGYTALHEEPLGLPMTNGSQIPSPASAPPTSYFPLLLILLFLLTSVGVFEWGQGSFEVMRATNHFMAGFFLVFSFFKLLDVRSFADSYATYDIIAARWGVYGLIYPFIELALGLAYLSGKQPILVNLATLMVMGVSAIGVLQAVMARRKIRCACLGTVFNLPMSFITLVEDGLMIVMAGIMLGMLLGSP